MVSNSQKKAVTVALFVVLTRRLEDRIRGLCKRLAKADDAEFPALITELQAAIKEHALRLSNITTAALVSKKPPSIPDRRQK